MKYLANFNTEDEYTIFKHSNDSAPVHVAHVDIGDTVHYYDAPVGADEYYYKPFTIEISNDPNSQSPQDYFEVGWNLNTPISEGEKYVKYSFDGGKTWVDCTSTIPADTPVMVISNYANAVSYENFVYFTNLPGDAIVKLSGNICSIGGGLSLFIDPAKIPSAETPIWTLMNSSIKDVENLWLPSYAVWHHMFCDSSENGMFLNTPITKTPHLVISTSSDENLPNAYGSMFRNTPYLTDCTNIVFDIPKNMRYHAGHIYFGGLFGYDNEQQTPAAARIINIPEYVTLNQSTEYAIHGMFSNITLPAHTTSDQKYFFTNYTNLMATFKKTHADDLSYVWMFTGDRSGTEETFAYSTITKTPRLYTSNIYANTFTGCSDLTDVYFYCGGTALPAESIGLGSDWTGTFHVAPWTDYTSLATIYQSATWAVDNTAILIQGHHLNRQSAGAWECLEYNSTVYRFTGFVDYNPEKFVPYTGFDVLSNDYIRQNAKDYVKYVIYNDVWYPVTWISEIENLYFNGWDYNITVNLFSFTDGEGVVHKFMVRKGDDGNHEYLYFFEDGYITPEGVIWGANIPDSMKFKYIN